MPLAEVLQDLDGDHDDLGAGTNRPGRSDKRLARRRGARTPGWLNLMAMARTGLSYVLEVNIAKEVLKAIKLSPYRAGPATPRLIRLSATAAFLACYCPLHLSDPGKPLASIFHEAMWCERLGLVCLRLQD